MDSFSFDSSDFLFARPSFLAGFASIVDPVGTLIEYNQSLVPTMADRIATRLDWLAVGKDLFRAISQYQNQNTCLADANSSK